MTRRPPTSTPFPYTTLFRSGVQRVALPGLRRRARGPHGSHRRCAHRRGGGAQDRARVSKGVRPAHPVVPARQRSEEHTSELQSRLHLVCRLLLEKKKNKQKKPTIKYDHKSKLKHHPPLSMPPTKTHSNFSSLLPINTPAILQCTPLLSPCPSTHA